MKRLFIISIILFSIFCISKAETFGIEANGTIADPVDLGLSVKWASWNIGAMNPEESGSYFAWGETSPKTYYTWRYYKYGDPPSKYNSTDLKNTLEPEDDAAAVNWGGNWRMPTHEEEKELVEKCSWTYVRRNGINGYRVTGPNGNSIFLPFVGLFDGSSSISYKTTGGWYWSSNKYNNSYAYGLYLTSSSVSYSVSSHEKCDGHVIRPVYDEYKTSNKRTIFVSTAGTLSSYISDSEKNDIEELTISGKLNGTDFRLLREMAGRNYQGLITYGHLKVLDLSNAQIVSGGDYYVDTGNLRLGITSNNVVPRYLFHDCNLTKIVFPSSITKFEGEVFEDCVYLSSVNIPSNVTSIGGECFYGCSSLQDITIPNSVTSIGINAFKKTPWLDKQSDGVVYAGKVAYTYKGTMASDTYLSFTSGTVGIADNAFENYTEIKSVTLPNSIKDIGQYAFYGCTSIQSVTSNITSPFPLNQDAFDPTTFENAILYVPNGRISTYSSTNGWSNFRNIIDDSHPIISVTFDNVTYELNLDTRCALVKQITAENIDLVIPSSISYNDYSYTVNAVGDFVFQNGIDNYSIKSVSFPSTISEVSESAFRQFAALSIIWNSTTPLPSYSFNSTDYKNRNFLLYVSRSDVAPSNLSNVVINGTASEITLMDGYPFHCPNSFTANKISYTHNYKMETGVGVCAGWETIALPFNVQSINHQNKGKLVPFMNWDSSSSDKPFWLYSLTRNGFVRTSSILANTPYLISMPNNSKYTDIYNVNGKVTFSSTYVTVHSTIDSYLNNVSYANALFIPNYTYCVSDSYIYGINSVTDFFSFSGGYTPGSVFLPNYRTIYPFEAKFQMHSYSRSIDIVFADDVTDIDNIILQDDINQEVSIYNLQGNLVKRVTKGEFESLWSTLPKGVYIINREKRIK